MPCEILASYVPTWLAFPGEPALIAEIWEHKCTCEECRKDRERYDEWRKNYYAEKQLQETDAAPGSEDQGSVSIQQSGVPMAPGDVSGVLELAGGNGEICQPASIA